MITRKNPSAGTEGQKTLGSGLIRQDTADRRHPHHLRGASPVNARTLAWYWKVQRFHPDGHQVMEAGEHLTLLVLVLLADDHHRVTAAIRSTLVELVGADRTTLRRRIHKLEQLGLLRVDRAAGSRSHDYYLPAEPGRNPWRWWDRATGATDGRS